MKLRQCWCYEPGLRMLERVVSDCEQWTVLLPAEGVRAASDGRQRCDDVFFDDGWRLRRTDRCRFCCKRRLPLPPTEAATASNTGHRCYKVGRLRSLQKRQATNTGCYCEERRQRRRPVLLLHTGGGRAAAGRGTWVRGCEQWRESRRGRFVGNIFHQ